MDPATARSNLLMSSHNSALLVVDVQEKLAPLIRNSKRVIWNIGRLIEGARLLNVPILATEQYPRGLGPTVGELKSRLCDAPEKSMFSCRECAAMFEQLRDSQIENILITGIETHVCVQQTTLDLLAAGFNILLAVDALGSRFEIDHETALLRMRSCGAMPTTTEAALFEWCETSAHPHFKAISSLVRQSAPEDS